MIRENFDALCKQHNIAPTTAMKNIGISYTSYLRWNETSRPHPRSLKKIADYFGVSVDWLCENHDFDNINMNDITFRNARPADTPENESRLPA